MLAKLEKKIGKYAIKNLIYYILGGYVIGYLLYFLSMYTEVDLYQYIILSPSMVMRGEVWRLFTWILTIPDGVSFFVIFMFLLCFFVGKSLEQSMGAFRYNVYIFSGWFFMTLGSMLVYWISSAIAGPSGAISYIPSTYYINMTSFLLFAMIFPQARLYFFGILPVRAKVLAIIDLVYLGLQVTTGIVALFLVKSSNVMGMLGELGYTERSLRLSILSEIFSIVFALLNFIIFFLASRDLKRLSPEELRRRSEFKRSVRAGESSNAAFTAGRSMSREEVKSENVKKVYNNKPSGELVHKCAICGRTSIDHPELSFRFCSKCNGNYEYCQDHLFTHVHVK